MPEVTNLEVHRLTIELKEALEENKRISEEVSEVASTFETMTTKQIRSLSHDQLVDAVMILVMHTGNLAAKLCYEPDCKCDCHI